MRAAVVVVSVLSSISCKRTDTKPPAAHEVSAAPRAAPNVRIIGHWADGSSAAPWFAPDAPPPSDLFPAPAAAKEIAPGFKLLITQPRKSGAQPKLGQTAVVHERAWTTLRQNLVDTVSKGTPTRVALEANEPLLPVLMQMRVGEKARAWADYTALFARAAAPSPKSPMPNMGYELELLALEAPVPALAAPTDLAEPPASAVAGADGAKYAVLSPGHGKAKVSGETVFKVERAVWKSDGSLEKRTLEPKVVRLDNLLPGERQIASEMTVGEARRIWLRSRQVVDLTIVDVAH